MRWTFESILQDTYAWMNNRSGNLCVCPWTKTKKSLKDVMKIASQKAFRGGAAGFAAGVVQVGSFMWLRTTMNYQYANGGTLTNALSTLYKEGGVGRFYKAGSNHSLSSSSCSRSSASFSSSFSLSSSSSTSFSSFSSSSSSFYLSSSSTSSSSFLSSSSTS